MVLPHSLRDKTFALELDLFPLGGGRGPASAERHALLMGYEEVAQYQIFDLWCWNAVGCSIVSYHLRHLVGRKETIQCNHADRILGTQSCALSVGRVELDGWSHIMRDFDRFGEKWQPIAALETEGNKTGHPHKVTEFFPNLKSTWHHHPGGPSGDVLDLVIDSIVNDGPVVMYVSNGGAAHVITLYGCSEASLGEAIFFSADPITGFRVLTLSEVLEYLPGWTWSYSMITKKLSDQT